MSNWPITLKLPTVKTFIEGRKLLGISNLSQLRVLYNIKFSSEPSIRSGYKTSTIKRSIFKTSNDKTSMMIKTNILIKIVQSLVYCLFLFRVWFNVYLCSESGILFISVQSLVYYLSQFRIWYNVNLCSESGIMFISVQSLV